MNDEERRTKLKLIKAALKRFPQIVKEKERAHLENEKVIRAFMPMARDLKMRQARAASSPKKSRPKKSQRSK